MDPNNVTSPKARLRLLKILHNGVQEGTGFSVAEVEWEGNPGYGIRWDGSPNSNGYPCCYGQPQWMIVNVAMIQKMMSVLKSLGFDQK